MIKNFFHVAWRNLSRNKAFTILNISGLAIGVVVFMLISIWLDRELSFDDFHPKEKSVFRLSNTFKSESESFSQAPSGPAFGAQLPKQLSSVKSAMRLFPGTYKLKYEDKQFVEESCIVADSNFFSFFGFVLKKGNALTALNSPTQMVITERLAEKYFGDRDPIGQTVIIDGEFPMTISGIAANTPPNSHIQFDVLIPSLQLKKVLLERENFDMDNFWVGGWPNTYVELADPAKWKETENQINEIAAKFSEKEWKENKMSYRYHLQPVRDIHLKSHLRYDAVNNGSLARVNIFSIIGIIVLLLACINYVNLTTAGAIKRAKETAVRKVIGAVKWQLVRQFFLETLLICSIAVIFGVVIFKILLPSFSLWLGQPYNFSFSAMNILFILGFTLLISLVAGIYPSAILSSFKPATALKGSFIQSKYGNLIRKSLVVFQFTITIALIASILIIQQQVKFIKNKSLGFDGKAVVEVNFSGESEIRKQFNSIRNQLMESPFILNVSKHSQSVVGGLGNGWTTTENLKGEEISTSLYQMGVDTNFLDTYDLKLTAGRFFSRDMPTDTIQAVLVNEAAVRTFGWQKPENAIGKRFGKGEDTRYVIGVVKDFHFESLHKPVEALMIAYARGGSRMSLKIDAAHIDEAINHLKKTWRVTAEQTIPLQYSFVDQRLNQQYGNEQKMQGIFVVFSALSLLIACLGLFGLTTFVVEHKVKEIGIRKVLGASVTGIVNLLSFDFLRLVLISLLIASPLAWYFMHNWLQDFAYRISVSWWIFIVAGLIALFIALVTVSFQAIKAALANPVKSLRAE